MQPLIDGMEAEDVGQWLRNGWFCRVVKDEPDKILKFEGTYDEGQVVAMDGTNGRSEAVNYENIRTHWPVCGAVNVGGAALYVQRHQSRQWRRTYTARGVTVSVPNRWELLGRIPEVVADLSGDNWRIVHALFEADYPETVEEAVRTLATAPTVALNPQIMFVSDGDRIMIYYRNEFVGEWVHGTFMSDCDNLTGRRVGKLLGGNV